MEYTASAKYLRVSPRKLKLLVNSVKEMPLPQLETTLSFMPKSGSRQLAKLLKSVIANAKQQGKNIDELRLKSIDVLAGGALKRFRPVSRGMAHSYKKRMSHVKIVLSEQEKQVLPLKKEIKEELKPEKSDKKELK